MALVMNDTNTGGKMHDFEAIASFITPHYPIIKKKASKDAYKISDLNAEDNNDDSDSHSTTKKGT